MPTEATLAGTFVKRKIDWLSDRGSEATTRAALAKLRRGIGREPGSVPELWEMTLGELPEVLLSKGDAPSRGEWAVHTALTLFALHQQGKDTQKESMCKEKMSLGTAVRRLADRDPKHEEAVKRRFHAAAMSDSFETLSWRIRGLIQLLKANDIPLDYPALTEDLYWFQVPAKRDAIRLTWGQDFYPIQKNEETDSNIH